MKHTPVTKESKYIAKELKKWRLKRGYSQVDLARKAKVERRTIIRLEQAQTDVRLVTFFKILKALEIRLVVTAIKNGDK